MGAAIAYAITAERLKELGFEGVLQPMTVSCADHEGTIQAASRPGKITSWYVSDDSVIDPMVREAAANFAAEKKIATGRLLTH
jgi:branched-chain amino acid transport system substrate-binding protein